MRISNGKRGAFYFDTMRLMTLARRTFFRPGYGGGLCSGGFATTACGFGGEAMRFFDVEAVLLWVLLTAFFAVFVFFLLVAVFFCLSAVFVTCAAGVALACREACAIDVKGSVVKSKAQSVIEIRFIRATEQSSG